MTQSGRHRLKSCETKRRYATSAEAEATARHQRAESGHADLEIYPCMFCHGWHIGHPPRRGRKKSASS
ncbi:MAG TPA: hypothetical protein VJ927_11695 [Actinomycetota bacterium]|nr:hypothetical protein [Actinomycetota bacterium]